MKKVLSLFLAILMIFAAFTVGSSAEGTTPTQPATPGPVDAGIPTGTVWQDPESNPNGIDRNTAVLVFYLNGGTLRDGAFVYDWKTGNLIYTEGEKIKDIYTMVAMPTRPMTVGTPITLPTAVAPKGFRFEGWYCSEQPNGYYPAVPSGFMIGQEHVGTITHFTAVYSPAEVEEDTLKKVLSILVKIFGTIIGILFFEGQAAEGQALLEKLLEGVNF